MENIVYLYARSKGYSVSVGRIGKLECDFILSRSNAEYAYIQLWRLYDYIYRFIIVVSNKTFSGHPKNITFKPFEENINSYKDKIDIAYYDNVCNKNEYPFHNSIWCRENSQRDLL